MKFTQLAQHIGRMASATLLLALGSLPAWSGSIPVPDGDFTDPSGTGSVGGALLGGSGTSNIGSGPWKGTYNSVAGLLLQPELSISATGGEPSGGKATISGLVQGLNGLNVVDSNGYFSQDLGMGVQANTTYTLTANVDPGQLLAAGALTLANNGVGIGLTGGGTMFADTTNPAELLSITLLGGTDYKLVLTFTTSGVAPSGNLGLRLFDDPSAILQANLLGGVSFSNVTLDATGAGGATAPEPGSLTLLLSGMACVVLGFNRSKRQMILQRIGVKK